VKDENPEVIEATLDQLELFKRLKRKSELLERAIALKSADKPRPWHSKAREKQLEPQGDFSVWLVMAGRGWGKTEVGANWLAEQAVKNPDTEWAIVAPTWRDCKKTCIEGKSGLLKAFLPGELDSLNASDLTVRLKNGSKIYGYSADGYDRLRGSNLSGAWIDEAAAMGSVDDMFREALLPALRIGKNPRVLITTTPRPIQFLKELIAREDGSVYVTKGSTWENAENLSESALTELRVRYEDTRIGRQELEGELLDDIEGALWNHQTLEDTRIQKSELPQLSRIVVGVDPAVTSGDKSDFTGIIVAGRCHDGHLYILDDLTMKGTPHQCMAKAIGAYHKWHADRIVGEVNNGGDYIESVLRSIDSNVAYKTVRATRGKLVRAEPISALWEQGRGHIVGYLPKLEDQMATYTADAKKSPDELDACFIAGTPVLTSSGEVPIEKVVPGDLVWTRAGWKPVLRSECTRRDATVMSVKLSNGNILTGTPSHRIWTGNGWTRLDDLVCGDILEGWTTTHQVSNSKGSPSVLCRAPSVPLSSGSLIIAPSPRRAALSVVGLFAEPAKKDVYDLMVAQQHEFVAAGAVVHNCVWACTELNMGASAAIWLSAISSMCDNPDCGFANTKGAAFCLRCREPL
jgi:phage terminase large subunit-like protein